MLEFLKNLTTQEWYITITTFLAANFTTIAMLVIALIKNKIKQGNFTKKFNEALAKANIQFNDENLQKLNEIKITLDAKLNDMLEVVYHKLKIDTDEKRKEIEVKSKDIQQLIQNALESISLEDKKE